MNYTTNTKDQTQKTEPTQEHTYLSLFETFGATWILNGSSEAVADQCPFCGKQRHCYLNVETGCFDCKSCGEQGNALTFIRHEYKAALAATKDTHYQRLRKIRELPLQTLKRHGLAWHDGLNCWLIPFKSAKGEVLNLVRYTPSQGKSRLPKLNLPALPVCLYGVDQLSDDVSRLLFLTEGPFDAIALDHHLREKKTRPRYDILAVPGAGTFKERWADFVRSRKVRVVFDNDEAGRKGQERAAKIIEPLAAEVFALRWPDGLDEGYDLSDLIHDGVNVAEFTNEHCVKVSAGRRRITFVRGDAIAEEPVDWFWEGHIQFGTFVSLSGLMGTHKSGIARDVVARATAGLSMPNCTNALPPLDVLYFTSEDAAARVRDLVSVADGNLTRLHVYDIACATEPIDILDCLEEMETAINSRCARLVVMDALNSFVGGNISTDAKARRTLSGRLQALARRTGAAVIGVRNWGRMEGGTSSQKSLGAVSLSDVARSVINTLETDPTERDGKLVRQFQLEFEKVSDAPPPTPIPYEVKDLSTGSANSHLRRIVWGKPIDADQVK